MLLLEELLIKLPKKEYICDTQSLTVKTKMNYLEDICNRWYSFKCFTTLDQQRLL